jgi:hypothetical protein
VSPRSIFLSKLIGLYCVVGGLAFALQKPAALAAVNDVVTNPGSMLILGVFVVIAGLAMVIGHNVWSGGAPPVIVTLVGWLTLMKGTSFLFLSPQRNLALMAAIHYDQYFYLYMALSIALGAYLAYSGFRAMPRA